MPTIRTLEWYNSFIRLLHLVLWRYTSSAAKTDYLPMVDQVVLAVTGALAEGAGWTAGELLLPACTIA